MFFNYLLIFRNFILITLWIGIGILGVSGQKNVLILLSDDLGYDYTPFWGVGVDPAPLPRLTALRDTGLLFRNFWATPACSPTRSSLMAGRYPFRTGVGGAINGTNTNSISASEWLFPKIIKKHPTQNYRTALIGKYHISSTGVTSPTGPVPMGWGYYAGQHIGALPSYFNWSRTINYNSYPCTTYATTQNVNDAIAWLDTVTGPWVLCMAFNAPHNPYHLPPNNLHSFTNLSGIQTDIDNNPQPYFKAMCEALDTEIGRMADSMRVKGLLDSTIIIYFSDNGTNSRFFFPPLPFYQGKGTLYESGVKTPLVVAGPDVTTKGSDCSALVSVVDIFKTVLAIAQLPQDSIPNTLPIDGIDFSPYFKNANLPSNRTWLYSETFNNTALKNGITARNNRFQLLLYDNEPPLFFDIQNDPFERTNLLARTLTAFEISQYNLLCDSIMALRNTSSACSILVTDPNNDLPNTAIKIYPNPANGFLNIWLDSNELSTATFRIFNQQGKEVLPEQSIASQQVKTISITNWAYGIYLVEIHAPNRNVIRKKFMVD